jgi:CubicO group peptidase (beta-lactamase class C family)
MGEPVPLGLRDFIAAGMAEHDVPGVAVGVVHGGREYASGFGVTSLDNPLDVGEHTFFQIGSISKTFLATAVMRLVDEGVLELNAPVRRYLPDLQLASGEATETVTLWHCLTHTAGFDGDGFFALMAGLADPRGSTALAEAVGKAGQLEQLARPGELFSYNNAAFAVLGRVIETVTGKGFEAAMRDLVLGPLGMHASTYFPDEVMTRRFAAGHTNTAIGARVTTPWPLGRASAPAGGVISNVSDMLTYARFQLGDGAAADGTRVLRPETMRKMRTAQAPAGSMCENVGIAWMLDTVGKAEVVKHGGLTNGHAAQLAMVPASGFAVIVLTNSAQGGVRLHGKIVARAIHHYLGESQPAPRFMAIDRPALQEFTGRYEAFSEVQDISADGGQPVMQWNPSEWAKQRSRERGANPAPVPPVRLAFTAPDRVVAIDEPLAGDRGEFIRDGDGGIAWFRWHGRIGRRVGSR